MDAGKVWAPLEGGEAPLSSFWLVYSPAKMFEFCICCFIYSRSDHQCSMDQEKHLKGLVFMKMLRIIGSASWKEWQEMERNSTKNRGVINAKLQLQIEENQKWSDIFTKILHCIKFLRLRTWFCKDIGSDFSWTVTLMWKISLAYWNYWPSMTLSKKKNISLVWKVIENPRLIFHWVSRTN